jgi:aryl-alcohol dehydrogenase-like predicted oxidoreductase
MELVLGTAQLDGTYGVTRAEGPVAIQPFLNTAWELGFQAIDTARTYTGVERLIGSAGWAGMIHTKMAPGEKPTQSLEKSLDALQVSSVDVAYFHDPGIVRADSGLLRTMVREITPALAEKIGVSIYTPEEFDEATWIPEIVVIQAPMNILDYRIADDALRRAKNAGKKVYARSVFLQGVLISEVANLPQFLGPLAPALRAINLLAERENLSLVEVALGAVISRPGLDGLIVGAESVTQLKDIANAMSSGALDPDTLNRFRREIECDERLLDPRQWSSVRG